MHSPVPVSDTDIDPEPSHLGVVRRSAEKSGAGIDIEPCRIRDKAVNDGALAVV